MVNTEEEFIDDIAELADLWAAVHLHQPRTVTLGRAQREMLLEWIRSRWGDAFAADFVTLNAARCSADVGTWTICGMQVRRSDALSALEFD